MNIIEILKQDYQNFPNNQTFSIYAENVYFQDPLNQFTGVKRYQKMIGFLNNFFSNIHLEVHALSRQEQHIHSQWTLNMTSPLPWKPRISIPGTSELQLNQDELIVSHIDRWDISPWSVLSQNFFLRKKGSQ